jgi:hypothetical protein
VNRAAWIGAWRWARMIESGRWQIYDQDTHEPVPTTEERIDEIYPRDIFVTHRRALDIVRAREQG